MENAGQLIEDEELRAQIKGSGIGTSATRAEILKKLFNNKYLALNKKTQIVTPTLHGGDDLRRGGSFHPVPSEPGADSQLGEGADLCGGGGASRPEEYMEKLDDFIVSRTNGVQGLNNQYQLRACYDEAAADFIKQKNTKTRRQEMKQMNERT